MMKLLSRFLIWCLGVRLYLKIPYKLRRRLGMVHGEDMSDINALLKKIQNQAKS